MSGVLGGLSGRFMRSSWDQKFGRRCNPSFVIVVIVLRSLIILLKFFSVVILGVKEGISVWAK